MLLANTPSLVPNNKDEKRLFGIELEFDSETHRTNQHMSKESYAEYVALKDTSVEEEFLAVVHPDGSNIEFDLKPYDFNEAKVALKFFYDNIFQEVWDTDPYTGMHIHVNQEFCSKELMTKLVTLWGEMPIHYLELIVGRSLINGGGGRFMYDTYMNTLTAENPGRPFNRSALNLNSVKGTTEFRLFRASRSAAVQIGRLEFLELCLQACSSTTLEFINQDILNERLNEYPEAAKLMEYATSQMGKGITEKVKEIFSVIEKQKIPALYGFTAKMRANDKRYEQWLFSEDDRELEKLMVKV